MTGHWFEQLIIRGADGAERPYGILPSQRRLIEEFDRACDVWSLDRTRLYRSQQKGLREFARFWLYAERAKKQAREFREAMQ